MMKFVIKSSPTYEFVCSPVREICYVFMLHAMTTLKCLVEIYMYIIIYRITITNAQFGFHACVNRPDGASSE